MAENIPTASSSSAGRDVSIDYLRATLTVMVVAHHCALAYTSFARSDPGHYRGGTAPIVDTARWSFLDHAQNFNDIFFMSAMFFISGIFVWPSIHRRGAKAFLAERFLRLGIPFLLGTLCLMPLAYYAAWLFSGQTQGYLFFWTQIIPKDGFPSGPLWFVWVLLLFDIIIAGLYGAGKNRQAIIERYSRFSERHFPACIALLLLACAIAYVPFLVAAGPNRWSATGISAFSFQTSRLALYFLWFMAGCLSGAKGLERGLLSRQGVLSRYGLLWFAGAIAVFLVTEFLPRLLFDKGVLPMPRARALYDGLWIVSCVASLLGFLALFRRYARQRHRWMDSLARCAYAIYVVHYIFVLWTQFILLPVPIHAAGKFLIGFMVSLGLSWASAWLLLRIHPLRPIL